MPASAIIAFAATAMPYSHPQPIDRARALATIPHLLPGALALTFSAGYINAVVLGFFLTPVSHMTGAVSRLGLNLAAQNTSDLLASLAIIAAFPLGAILAGLLVGAHKLIPSRRYGFALLLQGLLLLAATFLLHKNLRLGLPLVSMACGLQNALSSSYYGLAIRTTHVTGLFTDVGVMIGHWLRHRHIDQAKLRFFLALISSFILGGLLGAYLDFYYGPVVLIGPALGTTLAGPAYWLLAHRGYFKPKPHSEIPNG